MYEEDAWLVAAKQVKAINPNITVVVWLDSLRIYTADKALNPDLKKSCTTGHFRPARFLETHPDYLLKNSTGQPAVEEPFGGCHVRKAGACEGPDPMASLTYLFPAQIFDHTKEAARNYWYVCDDAE